jgi:hypothetical protein
LTCKLLPGCGTFYFFEYPLLFAVCPAADFEWLKYISESIVLCFLFGMPIVSSVRNLQAKVSNKAADKRNDASRVLLNPTQGWICLRPMHLRFKNIDTGKPIEEVSKRAI